MQIYDIYIYIYVPLLGHIHFARHLMILSMWLNTTGSLVGNALPPAQLESQDCAGESPFTLQVLHSQCIAFWEPSEYEFSFASNGSVPWQQNWCVAS